jgi:hypothetical protein
LPNTSLTLVQRVAHYASDVIRNSANGDAMRLLVRAMDAHPPTSKESEILPGNTQERRDVLPRGGLMTAVLGVATAVRGEISCDSVLRKLTRSGHAFSAKDRKKSVSDALRTLAKSGKLVVTGKGPGGKSLYKLP